MAPSTPQTSARFVANYGDITLYTLTAVAMLVLGVLGWLAGGWFTLIAIGEVIGRWGVQLPQSTIARWSIPFAISLVEVAIFRFRQILPVWVLAVGGLITVIDFCSTVFGIIIAIGGLEIKLLTGFRVPPTYDETGRANPGPLGIGVLGAAILTFCPEQIVLAACGMLKEVATGLYKAARSA